MQREVQEKEKEGAGDGGAVKKRQGRTRREYHCEDMSGKSISKSKLNVCIIGKAKPR